MPGVTVNRLCGSGLEAIVQAARMIQLGEAEIVELGADLRPAFAANLPQVRREGRVLRANGLFRHGFLLAPALARKVADAVFDPTVSLEMTDADIPERRCA